MTEVVYMLGTPGSKTVKIGRTINLAKRFAEIQRMSPVPLAVLWSHPGGHKLETNLHRQFSALRVHGEWFTFTNDPATLIRWAVNEEPWHKPRVNLKKRPKPRILAVQRPAPVQAMPPADRTAIHAELEKIRASIIGDLEAIEDPEERYWAAVRTAERLKALFRESKKEIILKLKDEGRTWNAVGSLVGVTGARAQQISQGRR